MRIDAHHHLWRYTPEEYGWIDDSMHSLRRDFLPEDLALEAAQCDVAGTVAVQARQTVEETDLLLELAADSTLIKGVVGWAPIAAPDFEDTLARLAAMPLVRGLRHVVQAEPPGFLDDPAFNRGIAALTRTGLTYDILIYARQLAEATRLVDRHPNQLFVLDHIGKPDVAGQGFAVWADGIRNLAHRPNVTCKVSGMVTEADWQNWSAGELYPYFETVLDAFTPARLMAGTDWPVLTVACTYDRWWQTVSGWIAPLSASERREIEFDTAAQTYRLDLW